MTQDDFMAKNKAKKLKEMQAAYYKGLKPIASGLLEAFTKMRKDCAEMLANHNNLLDEIQVIKESLK